MVLRLLNMPGKLTLQQHPASLSQYVLWAATADASSSSLAIISLIKFLDLRERIVTVGGLGVHRGDNTRCELRAATTRIQHLSVAPAKVATALPQWTATTKPRKLQPAHRCPRNRKLLRTALNSTQQSLPRSSIHCRGFSRSSLTSDNLNANFKTVSRYTPSQTTRSRTVLSKKTIIECVFQLVGQTASNHTRCTDKNIRAKPETALSATAERS